MVRGRLQGLDLFRGAAAISVVLYHFRDYLALPAMGFAYVAVDLFFVLSGIVIAMKYTHAVRDGMPWWTFASLRLQRLYPMAFIAGVFILGLDLLGVAPGRQLVATGDAVWRVFLVTPVTVDRHAVSAFPADAPMWSLWAELAVNALWFLLLRLGRRALPVAGVLGMLAMLYFAWHLQSLNYGFEAGWPWRVMAVCRAMAWFAVGCAIGTGRVRAALPVLPAALVFLGGVCAVVFTPSAGWLGSVAIVVVGVVLLQALCRSTQLWPPLARASGWLGAMSYPLYLIHTPAGRLLPDGGGVALHWAALLGVMGATTAVATVCNERLVSRVHRLLPRRTLRGRGGEIAA